MKIVSLEWFEQSLERGMVLEETLYNPTLPTEQRGMDAWIRIEKPSPAPGKRMRDAEQSQPLNPNRRKLRRAASTKLGYQSDAIWAGITTQRTDQTKGEEDEWREDDQLKHTTPHEPVQQHDAGVIPLGEAEESNASTPAGAPPQHPEIDSAEGIFQSRIVVTQGFDQDKVRYNTYVTLPS